jgi:LysM repeat protein
MEQLNGTEDASMVEPRESDESEAIEGYEYVVRAGDSLSSIVQNFTRAGVPVSIEEILQANPGLEPTRLLIGQKIFVPAKHQ